MIIKEVISNTLVHTYSDAGYYIHGGNPQGDYLETFDPVNSGRTYIETSEKIEDESLIPHSINSEEATIEDYQNVLKKLGVLE